MSKPEQEQLGVLWEKENEKGKYWTGSIEVRGKIESIIVFINNKKSEEKQPDLVILKRRTKASIEEEKKSEEL